MATSKDPIKTSDIFVGDNNAPITLTIFIDYESVACANANVVFNQLLEAYSGKVRINFRHFPLSNKHQNAMKAAEAAVAAAQEGLFPQMHNILFANRKKLGRISLQSYAKQVGTTNKGFLDQVINGVYAWQGA
ncbi:MAG: oxidoreductase [Segetibacter sp.]|jgi:protein-disulfide isomerase|nr:oxidoreductase [Segetibacter sp.]